MTTARKKVYDELAKWLKNCERNALDGLFDEEFLIGLGLDESAVEEFMQSDHTGTVRSAAELVFREQLIVLSQFVLRELAEFAEANPDKNLVNEDLAIGFSEYLVRKGISLG